MSKTILVVDDDPEFLRCISEMLAPAGYNVLCAADAAEAVLMIEGFQATIDAAIVELALPAESGFEVVGRLSRTLPHLRLIATSGVYKEPYLSVALACGAHFAIPKPAAAAEWVGLLDQALARREQPGPPDGQPDDSLPWKLSARRYMTFRTGKRH